MGHTRLELIETNISKGIPLTLDDRVYYHEALQMPASRRKVEPVITNAKDILSLLSRRGLNRTEAELVEWLDKNNVPK